MNVVDVFRAVEFFDRRTLLWARRFDDLELAWLSWTDGPSIVEFLLHLGFDWDLVMGDLLEVARDVPYLQQLCDQETYVRYGPPKLTPAVGRNIASLLCRDADVPEGVIADTVRSNVSFELVRSMLLEKL